MPAASPSPDVRSRLRQAAAVLLGRPAPAVVLGPGQPVAPNAEIVAAEHGLPRLFAYPPGVNTQIGPRGETPRLTTFESLRALATNYDIAAICIHHLRQELNTLEWAVVPRPAAGKGAADRLRHEISAATDFLSYPDGDQPLDQWAAMLLGEDLEIGAPVIYKRPTRSGRALAALEIIEGDTIKPLLNDRGGIVAFNQVYQGTIFGVYPKEAIIYAPRIRRRASVYGVAPLERVLLAANTALRRQTWQLAYYTEGNIPEALAGTPEGWSIDQIKEFQEWFDGLLVGDDAERRRIKMWPGDTSKIHEFRPYHPTNEPETWLLKVCCAIFGVKPEEIGFTEHVNRATASAQQDGGARTITAIARWIENILSQVIQHDLGYPDLVLRFQQPRKVSDTMMQAQADVIYLVNGVYDPDYVRQRDGVQLNDNSPLLQPPPPPPTPAQLVAAAQAAAATGGQLDPHLLAAAMAGAGTPAAPVVPAPAGPAPGAHVVPLEPVTPGPVAAAAKEAATDLRKWREKALRRVAEGRSPAVPFTSTVIPATLHAQIQHALPPLDTLDAVRAVFDLALAGLPPDP